MIHLSEQVAPADIREFIAHVSADLLPPLKTIFPEWVKTLPTGDDLVAWSLLSRYAELDEQELFINIAVRLAWVSPRARNHFMAAPGLHTRIDFNPAFDLFDIQLIGALFPTFDVPERNKHAQWERDLAIRQAVYSQSASLIHDSSDPEMTSIYPKVLRDIASRRGRKWLLNPNAWDLFRTKNQMFDHPIVTAEANRGGFTVSHIDLLTGHPRSLNFRKAYFKPGNPQRFQKYCAWLERILSPASHATAPRTFNRQV